MWTSTPEPCDALSTEVLKSSRGGEDAATLERLDAEWPVAEATFGKVAAEALEDRGFVGLDSRLSAESRAGGDLSAAAPPAKSKTLLVVVKFLEADIVEATVCNTRTLLHVEILNRRRQQ